MSMLCRAAELQHLGQQQFAKQQMTLQKEKLAQQQRAQLVQKQKLAQQQKAVQQRIMQLGRKAAQQQRVQPVWEVHQQTLQLREQLRWEQQNRWRNWEC